MEYDINKFGGAVVKEDSLCEQREQFSINLEETIKKLKSENVPVIWLSLPLEKSCLVHTAVSRGFFYHHATEKNLQMTLRLIPEAFIPPDATHYVGAGGVVLDENRNLLVISEKHHDFKHYKLPGGTLDKGEHISEAAVREVFEETGIQTEFISLACFRHWHGYRFDKSDIYFVCRLKPLTHEITADPQEIDEAFWMPVDEYLKDPKTHPFNKKIVQTALSKDSMLKTYIDNYGRPETHELFF